MKMQNVIDAHLFTPSHQFFLQQWDVQWPVIWTKQVQKISWSRSDRTIGDNLAGSQRIFLGPPLSWHDSLGYTNGNRADKRRKREPAKIESQGLRGYCSPQVSGDCKLFCDIYNISRFSLRHLFAKICNFLPHWFLFILIRSNLGWVSNTSKHNLRLKKLKERSSIVFLESFFKALYCGSTSTEYTHLTYIKYKRQLLDPPLSPSSVQRETSVALIFCQANHLLLMFCLLSHNPVLVYLHSSHRLSSCWMVFGGGQSGVSDPSVAQSCS